MSPAPNDESKESLTGRRTWSCGRYVTVDTVVALLWLISGLFYCLVIQDMTPVDSLYLLAQIVSTVGYGDLTPTTTTGQLFLTVYVLTAALVVSNIISTTVDNFLDQNQDSVKNFIKEAAAIDDKATGPKKHIGRVLGSAGWTDDAAKLLSSGGVFLVCVLSGTVFFAFSTDEEKTWVESLYMAVITMSTVGFGDKLPLTTLGKVFASVWMLVGAGATLNFVTELAQASRNRRLRRKLDVSAQKLLHEMDGSDGNGKVNLPEFMRFVLVTRSLVSREVVDEIISSFETLDTDSSGDLTVGELKRFSPSPSTWEKWMDPSHKRTQGTAPRCEDIKRAAEHRVAEYSAVLFELAQGLRGEAHQQELPICVDTAGRAVDFVKVASQLEIVDKELKALIGVPC